MSWPVLTSTERRVLGVLIEKQKTTPDVYPMSLNGLVTGCNQKSNRDPVMSLEDYEVEDTLNGLQKQALATRVESGRVDKWRHLLYESWSVNKTEIAVIAELLLRGPQTEGELRSRVSRMAEVPGLDELRAVCKPLAERGLAMYLTAEGRRGTTLTHGFHDPAELDKLRARFSGAAIDDEPARSTPTASPTGLSARMDQLAADHAALAQRVAELERKLSALGG
ncbi:MAG: YceH family protein [Gemmataceae bacterium]